jgi:mRNA interferase HigB
MRYIYKDVFGEKGSQLRVVSKKKIRDYCQDNVQAELPLIEWYFKMCALHAKNLTELRKTFNSADPVHGYTIFNIGGNNYRLITAIHYNTQLCYIRDIWTHAEYSKASNQLKLERGKL